MHFQSYLSREDEPHFMEEVTEKVLSDKAPLDGLVQSLSKIAETYKAEIPITFSVKGTIITGILIGNTAYSDQFSKAFLSLTSNQPAAEDLIKILGQKFEEKHAEHMEEFEKLGDLVHEILLSHTRFIHLKNANIVNLNGQNLSLPVQFGGLIRIRTDSIDAFWLGMYANTRKKATNSPEVSMRTKEVPINAIPDLQLVKTVTIIKEIFESTEGVKYATGVFFDYEDELYLVTNRHVVYNEEIAKRPVALKLSLNRKDGLTEKGLDLTKHDEYKIDLYSNGNPVWLEHPDNPKFTFIGDKIDIAVIPLNKEEILDRFLITRFDIGSLKPATIPVIYGQALMVMGYPLGFYDELNNLPIVRNATMASAFSAYYRGRPIFLIDSRLHQGVSGSPVLTNTSIPVFFNDAWNLPNASEGHEIPMPFLLGIVSKYLSVMDERTKEYIGLSEVFQATLIPEIIAFHKNSRQRNS